jgi:hypothetical protein
MLLDAGYLHCSWTLPVRDKNIYFKYVSNCQTKIDNYRSPKEPCYKEDNSTKRLALLLCYGVGGALSLLERVEMKMALFLWFSLHPASVGSFCKVKKRPMREGRHHGWRRKSAQCCISPVKVKRLYLTSRFTAPYSARQRAPFSSTVFLNSDRLRCSRPVPCMWQNCCQGIMIRGPHECLAPANLCTRRQPALQQPS